MRTYQTDDDRLAPSRGLLWGVCAGLVIYAVVAGAVWAVWRGR